MTKKLSWDLTHLLHPSSHIATDVIFVIGDDRIPAHKRDEVIVDVEGVGADTFTLFLHHNYGKKLEVSDASDFRTLAELYTLANKFEDKEMLKKVVKRMIELVAEDGEIVFPSKLFESVSTHHVTEVEEAIANKLTLFLAGQPPLNPETVVAVVDLIPEPTHGGVAGKDERRDSGIGKDMEGTGTEGAPTISRSKNSRRHSVV